MLHILEAFKRRTFITHFSFAPVGPELICENKLSSQMSSVFFPKGCCQVKWEDVWQGQRKRHSICTRMFGHTECQFAWDGRDQGRHGKERWNLFSFISHSIKHHLLCHFTHSHVSNWLANRFLGQNSRIKRMRNWGRAKGVSSTALNGRQVMYTRQKWAVH